MEGTDKYWIWVIGFLRQFHKPNQIELMNPDLINRAKQSRALPRDSRENTWQIYGHVGMVLSMGGGVADGGLSQGRGLEWEQ